MKVPLALFALLSTALYCGTIANPTPIENGKTHTFSKADPMQNYFFFTMSNDGNVLISSSGAGFYFYEASTLTKIPTNLSSFYSATYGNIDGGYVGVNVPVWFRKGSYLLQAKYTGTADTFFLYSNQISNGTNLSTSASSVSYGCNEELFSRVIRSGVWHLLGAKSSGCGKSRLRALGAVEVWSFSSATNIWSTEDAIGDGEGVWIKK